MASLSSGLQLLASATRYALAGAGLVTPALLSRPTPCAGWDLELLLDHMSDSAEVLHQAITAGCIGLRQPRDDDSAGLDPVSDLHQHVARLLAACGSAGPAPQLVTIGDRELTTNLAVLAGAMEITVHGWDISVACGPGRPIPPSLAAILLPLAPLLITPASRHGLFAEPVLVPAEASAGDQLIAFLGRHPSGSVCAGPA
jgi:uncharacterized protein (TIGR03086 family)